LSETYAEYFPAYDPADVLQPADVARFVVFLLSKEAEHITGSVTVMRSKTARTRDVDHERLIASREAGCEEEAGGGSFV
jgi:NAD(P)-dependent dehydrogenase (short-subunit alcohol dehydrogenase family)